MLVLIEEVPYRVRGSDCGLTTRKEILVSLGFVLAFWIIANVIVSIVYWMNLVLLNVEVDTTGYATNLFFILVILYVIDIVMDKYDLYKKEKEAGTEAPPD